MDFTEVLPEYGGDAAEDYVSDSGEVEEEVPF